MLESDIQKDFYNRSYNIEKSFNPELITEDTFNKLLKSGYSVIDNSLLEKAQVYDRSHLIKKEVWAQRNGKTFKQTVYVHKDEPEIEYEAAVGEEISPIVKGMNIVKYSDKSILITGDTYVNKDELRKIKEDVGVGSWNNSLKGWIFPIKFKEIILARLWGKQLDKGNEEKAEAIKNQKNESLNVGDVIELTSGIGGEITNGASDNEGIKYNITLTDNTKLDGVNEKVINVEPETKDSSISEIINSVTPESRVKTQKQLFGLQSIKDLHNYTLSELFKLHGISDEDINTFISAIKKGNSGDSKVKRSGNTSTASKESTSKIEGLTKRQLMAKLYHAHYQSLKKAIDEGLNIKEGALDLYPDLQESYSKQRQAMSEETKRKISEALKKYNPELEKYKLELNELITKRDKAKQEFYDLFKQAKDISNYAEAEKVKEEGRQKNKLSEKLDKKIRNHKNIVQVLENGGVLETVEDKVGVVYSNIPSFTNINTEDIDFNVDNILTKEKPPYIPEVNEDEFRLGSFIFDMIKINDDKYLLATNKYREKSIIDHGYTKTKDGEYDPNGGGFVSLTLDQLVLTQDYYITKQKALYKQEAENKNKRELEYWNKKEDKSKEYYYNQRNFYESLPVAAKKKVTKEQWEKLSLKEKEEIYIPIKKHGAEKIKSNFDNKHMAHSFHSMYERFVDPTALRHDSAGKILQRGETSGKQSFANKNAWDSWQDFRQTLDFKINDINIQREEIEGLRGKAIETSYGESNTNDILLNEYGVKVKRQNGEQIKPQEIEQLKNAWVDVQKSFGRLTENAKKDGLKLSHAGTTYMFASTAIGVYVPRMKTIGVTNKLGENQLGFTMGHEVAHWIDNTIGKSIGKRHISDNYDSTAGKIATIFRKNMNSASKSNYVNATHECFARAFEQYHAIESKGEGAIRSGKDNYFISPNYVNEKIYSEQIKPLIKQFLEENKKMLKSTLFDIFK